MNASVSVEALIAIGLAVLYSVRGYVPHIPGAASILARLAYWRSAIEAVSLHPLIGAPRSVVLIELGNRITWNPYNSVLWLAVNFGLIGVVSYCSYVWLAMREIAKAAAADLWRGIFVGMILTLAWGLEEIIVLTP